MKLTTGFTLTALLISAVTLTACDKSTPTYPGAVKTTDDQSSVVPVADSAVPVAISDANINNDVKTALLRDDDLKKTLRSLLCPPKAIDALLSSSHSLLRS